MPVQLVQIPPLPPPSTPDQQIKAVKNKQWAHINALSLFLSVIDISLEIRYP